MNRSEKLKIYTPDYRKKVGIIRSWVIMFRNVVASRELIWQLFRRDFLMSYKKSFLGIWWILLAPIAGIISWVVMNQAQILTPGDVGVSYPAYVLLSTSIWALFISFYTGATGTLSSGSSFILQVEYPHEALLVKQLMQQFANFLITFTISIIALLILKVYPDWKIIFFPLAILPLMFLGAAIGLIVSVFTVISTDINNIVERILGLWLVITPVIYAPKVKSDFLQKLIDLNPLTHLVGGVRDLIFFGKIEHFDMFMLYSVISFLLFLIALRLFFTSEDKVIEKII